MVGVDYHFISMVATIDQSREASEPISIIGRMNYVSVPDFQEIDGVFQANDGVSRLVHRLFPVRSATIRM